ncbi:MAG: AMP-binding protein [Planctomycetota bacterium]|nr:AMP-binding protein [Planctomycetota bacterium]
MTEQSFATPWVDGLTIGQALDETARRYPLSDALVFPKLGLRINYREFLAQVEQAARGLLALGVQPGEHVAIWATNVPQWVITQFATAKIGAVLVTINPAYRPFELSYVLKQSDAKVLLLVDRFKTSDYHAMLAEICPELAHSKPGELHSENFPKLRTVVAIHGETPPGAIHWNDMMQRGLEVPYDSLQSSAELLRPTDPINIQYTSGTTGFPKAATLSHRNLLFNVYYVGECFKYTEADRICIPVPFYHCFGCVLGTLCAAIHGAAMVVPAESFEPAATLAAIESEKATSLYGVPTMFIAQLNDPSRKSRDLSSLRTGIMSGSPCPIETMRAVISEMGCREITIGYGQTEASPIITQTRTEDPIETRVTTVGRPIPGLEVKIIDPATKAVLGDNEQGELCARGHAVMLGYYKNPGASADAIDPEGWLHTGDLAIRLPNGYYKITGRMKDMVIRGGENIYPREIEEFLFTHPMIEQASVVGVPDPRYGEELCAWIQLKQGCEGVVVVPNGPPARCLPGENSAGSAQAASIEMPNESSSVDNDKSVTDQQIREFCRANLAYFKAPRYIRFVTQFPQTVTGKIRKFKIREMMCEELGLKEITTA